MKCQKWNIENIPVLGIFAYAEQFIVILIINLASFFFYVLSASNVQLYNHFLFRIWRQIQINNFQPNTIPFSLAD